MTSFLAFMNDGMIKYTHIREQVREGWESVRLLSWELNWKYYQDQCFANHSHLNMVNYNFFKEACCLKCALRMNLASIGSLLEMHSQTPNHIF